MELGITDKNNIRYHDIAHTCTAAYATDWEVTLSFNWSFDAILQHTELLDKVFCGLVRAMFSASSSSSKIFFAEEGDVNILL